MATRKPFSVYKTFRKFAESWFIWGKCEYIQRKLEMSLCCAINRNRHTVSNLYQ